MEMRIGRTIPPAASPFDFMDIMSGVAGFVTGLKVVQRFEDELKSFFHVRYCFAVSSGKAAMVLILQALHEIFPGRDEVLIPAYTCYSVPSAITRAGFKVRLCDLAPGTLDFDFDRLPAELENPRLLCVIPTHLYGLPADVARVRMLIGQRDIFVLEDAAQAMGGEWNGKRAGTLGDAGLFSLGRGKAFTTVEGGLILTNNDLLGGILEKRLAALQGYGHLAGLKLILDAVVMLVLINPALYWLPKALPFLRLGKTCFNTTFAIKRLTSFQAGLALNWKAALRKLKACRAENTCKIVGYGIHPAGTGSGALADMIRFPVLLADAAAKKRILLKSARMGLGISDGYPDSIDGIDELGGRADDTTFPVAKDIAERLVTLPVHPYVNDSDLQKIMQLLCCLKR